MKPCHAAALALVGWYLMTPPPLQPSWSTSLWSHLRFKTYLDDPDYVPWPDTKAPIGRWQVLGRFDSEAECQAELDKQREEHPYSPGLSEDERGLTFYFWSQSSACFAGDDPRLRCN
jgi:hypothetical protein